MSDEKQYPSIGQQAKNLANFSWDLIKYIHENHNTVLFVSDDVYKERTQICKSCERFDDMENKCMECGCYIPGKARIILDSCPLNKWSADENSWQEKFEDITNKLDKKEEEQQTTFVWVGDEGLRHFKNRPLGRTRGGFLL